jgi:hypothetical protein
MLGKMIKGKKLAGAARSLAGGKSATPKKALGLARAKAAAPKKAAPALARAKAAPRARMR